MPPSNREKKKLNAIRHNEKYLESKKPKAINPISRSARRKAQTLLAIAPILSASVS